MKVTLGGQEHLLVFDNYAMMMLGEYLGEGVIAAIKRVGDDPNNFSVKLVAAMVLAGLQHNEKFANGMDMRKACKMLPKTGLQDLIEFAQPMLEGIVKCLGFDTYEKAVPKEDRAEHPTVSPSETGGESTGENSASSA
jgi:hypothetical protein